MVHREPTAFVVFVERGLVETVAFGREDAVHGNARAAEQLAVGGVAGDVAHVVGGRVRPDIVFHAEAFQRHGERQLRHPPLAVHVACGRDALAQVQDALVAREGSEERPGENHHESGMQEEGWPPFPHLPADGRNHQSNEDGRPCQGEPPRAVNIRVDESRAPGILHERGDAQGCGGHEKQYERDGFHRSWSEVAE